MFPRVGILFHMGTNARKPEAVSKAVSEELRVIRARLPKESVRDLASRCGVPYSTLFKTLDGARMVDVEELHKIAIALNAKASEVMAAVEARLVADDLATRRASKASGVTSKAARERKKPGE